MLERGLIPNKIHSFIILSNSQCLHLPSYLINIFIGALFDYGCKQDLYCMWLIIILGLLESVVSSLAFLTFHSTYSLKNKPHFGFG